MPKQTLALALCRVSSTEQLENNSLNRQREAVLKAADELDVIIPDDGWWSGSVSSKRGTNVGRKDIEAAKVRCQKDKRIKYLIVDEPDRFMRSIDEAAYYEVTFRHIGVTIYYASDPELNKGDLASKLLKFTKYLSAEGSNEERQNKSISGQAKAIREGRWPFQPKAGYKKGYRNGIPEVDDVRGPILKETLVSIASKRKTPSQALADFNKSDFMRNHSNYKMDKFREIVIDPFYAGVVSMDKQVKAYNPNGLHERLISMEQHKELVRIMTDKKKNQSGPRKNGNPDYPLSNMVTCEECKETSNGRLVGFKHGNGKPNSTLVYHKYRCRSCRRYIHRDELNPKIEKQFNDNPITADGISDLSKALDIVWKQKEGEAEQDAIRIEHKIKGLTEAISQQVEAATDPSNASIKDDILNSISKKKADVASLEDELAKLKSDADTDRERFLKFAFDFVENMGSNFLDTDLVSKENRLRCKELVFPAGFWIDKNNKVYTPEISPLYRLAAKKKDTEVSKKSLMVRVKGL